MTGSSGGCPSWKGSVCWITDTPDVQGASHDYYVRQLRDWKGLDRGRINGRACALGLWELCAGRCATRTPARAIAIAIAAYLGSGDVSTERSLPSPRPTPNKTTATTRPSPKPSRPAESTPNRAINLGNIRYRRRKRAAAAPEACRTLTRDRSRVVFARCGGGVKRASAK